jgi:outer membrane protein assembly factor BamB
VRWRAPVSSEVLSKPILHDGVVVVRCIDGRIFGFDAITGVRRWLYDRNVPLLTLRGNSPPLARGGVIYVGYDGGEVIALRVNDGTLIWEQPVSTREGKTDLERLADIDGDMAIVASDLYVSTSKGRLAALSLQSGRIQWVKDVGSAKGLDVSRTRLALADSNSQVWLVDRINSATLWKQDLIYTESGEFAARDRLDSDGISRAPLVIGTDMFIYTDAGNLYLYRAGAAI